MLVTIHDEALAFARLIYASSLEPRNWIKDQNGREQPWLPDKKVREIADRCYGHATPGKRRMLLVSAEACPPGFEEMCGHLAGAEDSSLANLTPPQAVLLWWLFQCR